MPKLTVHRDAHKRKAYIRKDGVKVKSAKVDASTFKIKDRGAKGRTPKSERWYEPKVKTGWEKSMPAGERRRRVIRAHKADLLAAGRSMQALANVTTDKATRKTAELDSTYFFREYAKKQGIKTTAKTPKR